MGDEGQPGITTLALGILGLFVAGTPMVAYLWETLNRLISGHFEPIRLLISIPIAVVFALLLRVVARFVGRWETERQQSIPSSERLP